jgi:hypothetical protein
VAGQLCGQLLPPLTLAHRLRQVDI